MFYHRCSEEQQQLERKLMQQWQELPHEMTGRRKSAKKGEDGSAGLVIDRVLLAPKAADDSAEFTEGDLFCEACRKWFKSEQQM